MLAQGLDARDALEHHAGEPYAHDEVGDHAHEQGVTEGVDGTGGRLAEDPGEDVGRAEDQQQDDRHDDDGHVTVDNRRERALGAALDRSVEGLACLELFLDTLGGDDVGVNAHTDRENQTGDTGQSHREGIEYREEAVDRRDRERHLADQRDNSNNTGYTVTENHKHSDQHKGNNRGIAHGGQGVLAECRADGAVGSRLQRKGQRAAVDLVREGGSRLGILHAGDDGGAVGNALVNSGVREKHAVHIDADLLTDQAAGGFGELGLAGAGEIQ